MAVGDLGVVQHPVERFEDRQRIFEEAVLQQPQHVGLRLDPTLGDRDHAYERIVDRHYGLPAARRVVERVAPDHCLLELGCAARRQARQVEVVERNLEDFGGLAGGHRGVQVWSAAWIVASMRRLGRADGSGKPLDVSLLSLLQTGVWGGSAAAALELAGAVQPSWGG